jgi:hypothetical protein
MQSRSKCLLHFPEDSSTLAPVSVASNEIERQNIREHVIYVILYRRKNIRGEMRQVTFQPTGKAA